MRFKDFKLLCDQKFGKISDEGLIKLLEKYDIAVEENKTLENMLKLFPSLNQHFEGKENCIRTKVNNKNKFEVLRKMFKSCGFNFVAYAPSIMFEYTYVFETEEEAEKAFNMFEVELEIFQGWWYGKEKFIDKVTKDYPHAEVIWAEL